ncbi:MAG: hypothetical protein OEM97_04580 [Acidimicrobiia bacterium]|nr:hypothetical protein [Acidimicrobiia bacterium]
MRRVLVRGVRVRRRINQWVLLGAGYLTVGIAGLSFLFISQDLPPLIPILSFVALGGFVEWRSVEVSPKLRASSTVMVIVAAGVAFQSYGSGLAMALVAITGAIGPVDLRERRIFFPATNIGQLVVSAIAGGAILDAIMRDVVETMGLLGIALAAGAAGLFQALVNFTQVAIIVRLLRVAHEASLLSGVGRVLPAYSLLSLVGGLLGATYVLVGPEVMPFIVIMVLMGHFAATSYAGVRESRESTMKGFIKALEARDLYARGHTERVSNFSRMIGEELGFSDERIERLRWAALLSDVSSLAVPRDLLDHQDHLTEEEQLQIAAYTQTVDEMLTKVEFLRPAMQIAKQRSFARPPVDGGEPGLDAHILGVAKRFDQLTAGGPRTAARSQEQSFDLLRFGREQRFRRDVVDALGRAIARTGMRYGAVELTTRLTRDDIAKRRMYERG